MTMRELGRTGIQISPIGLGSAQFSEGVNAVYPALQQSEVNAIVKAALDGGVSWFGTAELYGNGRSERALAAALSQAGMKPGDVVVVTKWWQALRTASHMERSIGERIANLSPFPIDLYQIHEWYGGFSSQRDQVSALARLVEAGKVRSVGVGNFSAQQIEKAHRELAKHGVPLACIEIQVNLLARKIETNGILETARRLGLTVIAALPLKAGMLTGKFHADREAAAKLPQMRRVIAGISEKNLDRTAPLIEAMREMARERQATIAQIALAWVINYYGDIVVATPGASKAHHAAEAAGAMKVELSKAELQRLADLSMVG